MSGCSSGSAITRIPKNAIIYDGNEEWTLDEYILNVLKKSSAEKPFEFTPVAKIELDKIQLGAKKEPYKPSAALVNNKIYRSLGKTLDVCRSARESSEWDATDDLPDKWEAQLDGRF